MQTVMICAKCGTLGAPDKTLRGGCLIELVLWCFFLVPGLIYSIWRRGGKADRCPACGSPEMVPLGSPIGKELAAKYGSPKP